MILVIDDETLVRNLVAKILQKKGYEVASAVSGEEGIEIYREKNKEIDAIILDMSMPGLSGIETYKELKKIDPEVKVIIATGLGDDPSLTEIKNLGVTSFAQKPFHLSELVSELESLIK